jgi:hypothetical protein
MFDTAGSMSSFGAFAIRSIGAFMRTVPLRFRRVLLPVLACAALTLGLAAPAGAASAHSWSFVCSPAYSWVRVNWPTIYTDSSERIPVYFRARLYQYTRSGWRRFRKQTGWYVGVSNNTGRFLLDSSFGELPYPFVGSYGHYFAYETQGGSYAGPQLGPFWRNLPSASYRVREQYSVNDGNDWYNAHRGQWCDV